MGSTDESFSHTVIEHSAPTPDVTFAAAATVIDHSAPAPNVTFAALATLIEHNAPAPNVTFAALATLIEHTFGALHGRYYPSCRECRDPDRAGR